MSDAELLELPARVAAYAASAYALGLAAWVLADAALPPSSRPGLRLLATLAGQMALTAMVVQTLGLLGLLRAPLLVAACLLAGGVATYARRERRPLRAFPRLLGQVLRLWLASPGWLLGPLTLALLALLGDAFFALPRDVDALSMHGPLIAEWVASGRVGLDSRWNYPQCWEYQFVPGYLLLRSDALVIVPGLSALAALLLALRELARSLRLGGHAAHLVALLCVASPVLWRESLKSDPVFAMAQLLGIVAIERASRGGRGSFWLLQLALFLVLGSKASGFFYAGLLGVLWLAVWLAAGRRRGEGKPAGALLARGLIFTLAFQASAAAVQVKNLIEHGNPMYPLLWRLGKVVLLDGPSDAAGTSLLDAAGRRETWTALLAGGRIAAGPEWPVLLLLLAACGGYALYAGGRIAGGRQRASRRGLTFLALLASAGLLWAGFAATPWVLALAPGSSAYLASGQSLRFAIAPLGLSYLVAAALLQHLLGRRIFGLALPAACLILVLGKWHGFGVFTLSWSGLGQLLAAWAAAALAIGAGRLLRHVGRHAGRPARPALRAALRAAPAALALAGLAFYAKHVEVFHRPSWIPAYREVWTTVWNEIPAGSVIAISDSRTLFRYVLYGPRFENRLEPVQLGRLGDRGELPAGVRYLYFFVGPRRAELEPAIANLAARGWRPLATAGDGRGALLVR